jgi:hypothetical protein
VEAFLAIEPSKLLVIHSRSLAPEQDQKASIAKPAMDGCKVPQPCAQHGIVRPYAAYLIEVLFALIT